MSIHEAALVDYAAYWLRRVEGQRLKTRAGAFFDRPKRRAGCALLDSLADD